MHRCTTCKELLSSEFFHRLTKSKSGLQSQCKKCTSIRRARERPRTRTSTAEERAAKRKAYGKAWREKNKDYLREKTYAWRLQNPERLKEIVERCRKKTMVRVIARNVNRRQRERSATPPWADRRAIEDLYVLARVLSKESGIDFQVDHVVPLNSTIVCGLHAQTNLQLLTGDENRRKLNKFTEVWP